MAWEKVVDIVGPPGTFDQITVDTIAADATASATIGGTPGNRTAHFNLPRGLPGVNAVENDTAVSTYMTTESRTATVLRDRGMPVSVIEFGAKRTDDTEMFDSSDSFAAAMGPGNRNVQVPAGVYYISRPIVIGPDSTIILDAAAVVKLKPMARCWMFTTDPNRDNGRLRWSGGTLDGRDADQGDWTLGGNAFDVSKGLVLTGASLAVVEDLTVRRVRGHGVNHWNNERFVARRLHFDQGIDSSQPAGGRRRDGVTGMSKHVDISNISGYSGDDLVAVIAGASWGTRGAAGAINIESVRISNVRPESSRQDSSRKAWRAVAIWCKDGRGFGSVTVDDVAGDTTLSHVAVMSNNDAPGTFGGYVTNLSVSRVAGTNHSSTEFGTLVFIQAVSVKHLNVAAVFYRPSSLMSLPAVRVHNLGQVTNLVATDVYRDDAAGGEPIFDVQGTGQLSVARFSGMSPFGLLLRKGASSVGATNVEGASRKQVAGDVSRYEAFVAGAGEDANNIVESGAYTNQVASANWPRGAEPNGQQMLVTRVGQRVQQTVFVLAGATAKIYLRASLDGGGTWTSWANATA